MGPVEQAVRRHVTPGHTLHTPSRRAPFEVSRVDDRGVELLLGRKKAQTRVTWATLEGVRPYLAGRGWVPIGGTYDVSATAGTLDAYLKQHINRATAGWIAALLEHAGVTEVDRGLPARIRLASPL